MDLYLRSESLPVIASDCRTPQKGVWGKAIRVCGNSGCLGARGTLWGSWENCSSDLDEFALRQFRVFGKPLTLSFLDSADRDLKLRSSMGY